MSVARASPKQRPLRIQLSDEKASANKEKRNQALSAAVNDHQGQLRAVIGRKIRDQIEAEDVLQDVFAEFLVAYDLGQAFETLAGWLVRVAQNKVLDRFRRQKTRTEFEKLVIETGEVSELDTPDDEYERAILQEEILNAIDLLPIEQRDVFVRHELEGQNFEEIAKATGVSVNTLLSRKRYAVLFLREHLKEIYDEFERE